MTSSKSNKTPDESPDQSSHWCNSLLPDEKMGEALYDYYQNNENLTIAQVREKHALEEGQTLPGSFGEYTHRESCPLCEGEMRSKFANRAASLKNTKTAGYRHERKKVPVDIKKRVTLTEDGYKVTLPKCVACKHYVDPDCRCDRCLIQMETNRQITIECYVAKYDQEFCEPNIEDLDAEKVLLLAWFRVGEKKASISQRNVCQGLSLSFDLPSTLLLVMSKNEVLERLQQHGLLKLDHCSLELAVEMTSLEEHVLHKDKLRFVQPFDGSTVDKQLASHGRKLFLKHETRDDVIRIMGDLCLRESLQFFTQLCRNRNLDPKLSREFASTLRKAVVDIGLYKTIACIEWAITTISKDIVDHGTPKYIAIDKIKSNLTNYWFNEEKEKKYEIKQHLRNETTFREPEIVSVFIENFLPFTVDYGNSLKEVFSFTSLNTSLDEELEPMD